MYYMNNAWFYTLSAIWTYMWNIDKYASMIKCIIRYMCYNMITCYDMLIMKEYDIAWYGLLYEYYLLMFIASLDYFPLSVIA